MAALERARKAREKLDAEARERAVQQEQQRAAEEERTRREAEVARQRADEERQRAAQTAGPGANQANPTGTAAGRTVRQICSTRENIISEQLCRARECRKSQHAGDPICVRLKEFEEAQQSGSQR
jgi:hypothetical protein